MKRATVAAAHHYRPGTYQGHLALFVPSRAAAHTLDRPLAWKHHAARTDVFFGPDGCDGDTMLKAPDVETFAGYLSEYLTAEPAHLRVRAEG